MTIKGSANIKSFAILHISNDYSWTKVHSNLYAQLDRLGCVQKVFIPLRDAVHKGRNSFPFETVGSELVYSAILNTKHRLLFRSKINFLFQSLQSSVEINKIDLVHATTLFSDGAIALKIWQLYGIPYVVSVRNTDIYTFLKYRPDLAFLAHRILRNAKRIIFISDAYKEAFLSHFLISFRNDLYKGKSKVIYNAIDTYWHQNIELRRNDRDTKRVLFIGRFDYNKNILRLIQSMIRLKKEFPHLELGLVGGGGDYSQRISDLTKHLGWVKYYGSVHEKEVLKEIYRYHDVLAMPSKHETFGLVYLEALSQGLPVLCSKGQGIDGLFDLKVGEFVNPYSIDDIFTGLKRLLQNRDHYDLNKIDFDQFRWSVVSKQYLEVYKRLVQC